MSTLVRTLAVAAAAAATVLMSPATADADAVDDAFLQYLNAQGVSYGSADVAVDTAHDICDYMDDGASYVDVVSQLRQYATEVPADDGGAFTAASVAAYCPRLVPQLPQ